MIRAWDRGYSGEEDSYKKSHTAVQCGILFIFQTVRLAVCVMNLKFRISFSVNYKNVGLVDEVEFGCG